MTITTEKLTLNDKRNVTLVTMLQSVNGEFGHISKRPAILILPGGGYSMCSDREAEVIAYPYLLAGYHAFVLRYSTGDNRRWPNPLNDYEQAMELIRSKEDEWHILTDKIAVIGFSAGGHLAACAATVAKNRPNAAILGYAALEQDIASFCQPGTDVPSPTDHVDAMTPPCFLFAARDDSVVPIHNTLNFESALAKFGTQFESHIYAYGGHGFGTGEPNISGIELCRRIPNWAKDSVGWLEDVFGQLTTSGMGKPSCLSKINGNGEAYLSVDCTLAYLRKQDAAATVLDQFFETLNTVIEKQFGGNSAVINILGIFKLRELLNTLGQEKTAIEALDAALQQIPNHF